MKHPELGERSQFFLLVNNNHSKKPASHKFNLFCKSLFTFPEKGILSPMGRSASFVGNHGTRGYRLQMVEEEYLTRPAHWPWLNCNLRIAEKRKVSTICVRERESFTLLQIKLFA